MHPAAREGHLAGPYHQAGQVRAGPDLVGAVVAEAAHFRSEEHARSEEVVAEPAYRVISVEGGRIRRQGEDHGPRGRVDPDIALDLEADPVPLHRIIRVKGSDAVVLVVGADR